MSGFFNATKINEFSNMMIQNLASLKIVQEQLKEHNISYREIENMEHQAFNLLINKIELEKGNSKVEVGVIGSFSSGKSTFINSLFGKPVCPMAVKPTTSSITKFYYGYKEKITINGKDISYKEYQKRSQHLNGDSKNTETNYIEYAYPFERLSSIVLYDTPGFNNNLNDNDTEVTMKTLDSVDVIFFIVDISKGAIDKGSIERLQKLNNKRMYCILNKSDLKSKQAIDKIKSEIISKRLFTEVIEYSASKVLEFAEKNYIAEHFKYIEEQLISKKIDFTTTAKGLLTQSRGRVKKKVAYKLYLGDNEYTIDDFYLVSKEQRARVEKMLNLISSSKQDTLKQKFKIEIYNYHKQSLSIAKDTLEKLNHAGNGKGDFDKFEQDIENFKYELYQFEKDNIDSFYNEWNYIFMKSCTIQDVSKEEKSFWSTPYSKIYLDKSVFRDRVAKIDSFRYMEELIFKWMNFFEYKHDFQLIYFSDDFKSELIKEVLAWYANYYTAENYIISDNGDIYFEDKSEAREYLQSFLKFEQKDKIYQLHNFLENNQESIEHKKRDLHSQGSIDITNIIKIQTELNNFIKEKKAYVNSL